MTTAGIWIDHRKAILVISTAEGEKSMEILSLAEKHPSREKAGGTSEAHESNNILADDQQQNKYTQKLNRYYAEIAKQIEEVDSILLFGPSEAKGELKKYLETVSQNKKQIVVETTDKMTEPQITAKIHEHFHTINRPKTETKDLL